MNTKWSKLVFVNVHASTKEMDENAKDKFYSLLDNTLNQIKVDGIQIIIDNFKGKFDVKTLINYEKTNISCDKKV